MLNERPSWPPLCTVARLGTGGTPAKQGKQPKTTLTDRLLHVDLFLFVTKQGKLSHKEKWTQRTEDNATTTGFAN